MRKVPKDTMYFNYCQMNPKNKSVGDCVVRSIALAMEKEWDQVYNDLCRIGFKYKLMPNSDGCYERYLKDNGWVRCKQPRKEDNTKYTGKEFCEWLDKELERNHINKNSIIISIGSHHLSCVCYGNISGFTINDTWDCSNNCVGKYWTKG